MAEKGGFISSKKSGVFISLKKKREEISGVTEAKQPEGPKFSAPNLYMNDVPMLPIDEKDVGSEMEARVKIIPRRVSYSEDNGKARYGYDLDVVGIAFTK